MPQLNRRAFLAGLAATPALGATVAAAGEPIGGFLAQSGKRGVAPLVIGLLTGSAPELHDLEIERLRWRHGYQRTLRYMSTDRNKIAFATSAIDYAAAARDLSFRAVVVSGGLRASDGADACSDMVRRLLAAAGRAPMSMYVRGRNRALAARLGETGATVTVVGRSGLAELAAFFTGCVYGEATGIAHPMKQALTDRLRRQVDPARFSVITI